MVKIEKDYSTFIWREAASGLLGLSSRWCWTSKSYIFVSLQAFILVQDPVVPSDTALLVCSSKIAGDVPHAV